MPTYDEVSRAQLLALSHAVGQSMAAENYIELQSALFSPWSGRTIPARVPYPSLIGDDHSPYEYSVAYGAAGAELRILFEAQAEQPTLANNHAAALLVNERLRSLPGVSLSRFERIADLFQVPTRACAQGFSLWHAACLSPTRAPDIKVYLNPQLHGAEAAGEVVEEVFARLGLSEAHASLERLRRRGERQDELRYVSLDLSDGPRARLKVYTCHHGATPAELERAFSVAPSHMPGDVTQYCATMAPGTASFDTKPVSSCLAFVGGSAAPHTATLHLPIAHYAESDAVARMRIRRFMQAHHMDQLIHARTLRAIARKPLHESSGVQSYASFRREKAGMRLTVYLSPELFRDSQVSSPRTAGASNRCAGVVGQSTATVSVTEIADAPNRGQAGA